MISEGLQQHIKTRDAMKFFLLFVFTFLTGKVTGEFCSYNANCVHTHCNNGQKPVCSHHTCTCRSSMTSLSTSAGESCHSAADCKVTNCNHNAHYHVACSNARCVCAFDACAAHPCPGEYICSSVTNSHSRVCSCTTNSCFMKHACDNHPCHNHGYCNAEIKYPHYNCTCRTGYTGQQCEEYNACIASPCPADYNCFTSTGSLRRSCRCTTPTCHVRHACDAHPCHNHGDCQRIPNAPYYNCSCTDGYTGQDCTETLCDTNPCHSNGHCRLINHTPYYRCDCALGFKGTHCENHVCEANSCLNNGVCVPSSGGHFTCNCPHGFTGQHCEVSLTTTPTVHHVTTTQPHVTTPPTAHRTDVDPDPTLGPYCLSCDDVVSPNTCDYITRCGPHEICYFDSFVTSMGTLRYNLGCRDTKICSTSKKRSASTMVKNVSSSNAQSDPSTIEVCTGCCAGHLCNSGGCGVTGYDKMTTAERGPVCFKCDQEDNPSGCAKIGVCGRDEACVVEHTHIATTNQLLWRSSCMHINECVQTVNHANNITSLHTFTAEHNHYGGIIVNNKCTLMCCLHDLCNRQCPDTPSVILG